MSNTNENAGSGIKRIQCEICGSSDVEKIDDTYFECRYCGAKYTKEEARKLFVQVSGSVKVDNSDKLNNLYTIARMEIDKSNYKGAKTYYDSILVLEPMSWEAHFYSAYCKFWTGKQGDTVYAYRDYAKCFSTVLSTLKANISGESELNDICRIIYDKSKKIVDYSKSHAKEMYNSDISNGPGLYNDDIVSIFKYKMEQRQQVVKAKTEYAKEVSSGVEVMAKLGDEIKRVFADNNGMIKKHAVKAWKYYVTNLSPLYKYIPNADQTNASILTKLNTYESKIKAYDSNYVSTIESVKASSNNPAGIITKQDKNSPEFKATSTIRTASSNNNKTNSNHSAFITSDGAPSALTWILMLLGVVLGVLIWYFWNYG